MAKKDITGIRGTLDFLREEGELVTITEEIDPTYEITAVLKALDNGPAFLFEKIKGYPKATVIGNLFSKMENVAKIFDVDAPKQLKFKGLEAMRHPLPPVVIRNAPCQEVVITDNIDVSGFLPILKSTERDGAHVMGSGSVLASGQYARGGHEISFKRMHFRGKDFASITTTPTAHLTMVLFVDHKGKDVPVTANISLAPAVMSVSATGGVHSVVPLGTDELAQAGALQGAPVEIVKARTVDAYAIANAEIVLEGYITNERVWETEEAEKLGKQGVTPFFPEVSKLLGLTWKSSKFKVTAITHRQNPIFYAQMGDNIGMMNLRLPFKEAAFYELVDRLVPGIVADVCVPVNLGAPGGVIFQVNKRNARDDNSVKDILSATLGSTLGIRMVIAVDMDVDIYSWDDVAWTISARASLQNDYFSKPTTSTVAFTEAGVAIDATVPFDQRFRSERPHFPVDKVDLGKWLPQEQIAAIRSKQSEYARCLAQRGW